MQVKEAKKQKTVLVIVNCDESIHVVHMKVYDWVKWFQTWRLLDAHLCGVQCCLVEFLLDPGYHSACSVTRIAESEKQFHTYHHLVRVN